MTLRLKQTRLSPANPSAIVFTTTRRDRDTLSGRYRVLTHCKMWHWHSHRTNCPDKPDRLSRDPTVNGRRYTIVAKAVDDKLTTERRRNELNNVTGGRQIVSVTMPRVGWLVCKRRLTNQQCGDH